MDGGEGYVPLCRDCGPSPGWSLNQPKELVKVFIYLFIF